MSWVGVKKLAVVPTFNTQFDMDPPADWSDQVRRRVFYDPDPGTGIDRSLRGYIEAISYGRAILEAEVFPHAFADGFDVFEAAADSLPDGHGYKFLLCVIPNDDGHAHRHGFFQEMTRNGVTFRAARVAMKEDLRRQKLGVWSMEVLHAMAELPDLYTAPLPPGTMRMGRYDNMVANAGTHSCAELKLRAGWLNPSDIAVLESDDGETANYDLHAIGLSPPPPGRLAAVRFPGPTGRPGSTMRVEARLRSDAYERGFAKLLPLNDLEFDGIDSDAVVVYEVGEAPDDISRHAVLAPGQSYETVRWKVTVLSAIPEGFSVSIQTNPNPTVSGRLLYYGDLIQQGTVGHSDPSVIGRGGWQSFKFFFAGGNNVIYAVNDAGELLRYIDASQTGGGDVSSPQVIGGGGWQAFKFLLSGGNGVIYAVNDGGELLHYKDLTQEGTLGHSDPVVIGGGGWQAFKFLLSGGNGVIYAVNDDGELLYYKDLTQEGTLGHSDPVVIGRGGWAAFKFLFAGGNNVIYAVNDSGQLLRYVDASQTGGGDVSSPQVIGGSSWERFKFLSSGGDGIIYAVVP
jgi:hypothetical protein